MEATRNVIALGEIELVEDLLATARTHATAMGAQVALAAIDGLERSAAAG